MGDDNNSVYGSSTSSTGPVMPRQKPASRNRHGFLYFRSLNSIRNKIIFSLLSVYVLGSLAAVAALYSTSHIERKIDLIESFYELNQKVLETRRYEKNYLLYGNDVDLLSALDYLDEARSALDELRHEKVFAHASSRGVIELETYATRLKRVYSTRLKRIDQPPLSPEESARYRDELREQGHELTQFVLEVDALARKGVEEDTRRYRHVALVILASALVVGGVLSLSLIRWIIGPLEYIRQAVAQIMRGELTDIPVEPVSKGCVECADLIRSLNMLFHVLEDKHNQLIQSAKLAAVGKVTAGIAHEINNPLNNISLTAEVLLEDLPNIENDDRMEMVSDIVTQADRAREVVRHLLDFSRSRKPSAWEKVDLVELIRTTQSLLRNQLRIGRVNVRDEMSKYPVIVMGNPNQLQQVLVNIFLNACQAMGEEGGEIKIIAREDHGTGLVEISDTGPGISEDIRRNVFDPFFTTKNTGTGLGLSLSYSIIKEHNGELMLSSEPGKGTAFRFTLPLHSV
ncbi:MAG: ATP-binding protein [Desulfobulbaceae bacterium]|nr:ATP-binding protein [Desulfobulbaceae bacterium]